jgi:hypothetical protein
MAFAPPTWVEGEHWVGRPDLTVCISAPTAIQPHSHASMQPYSHTSVQRSRDELVHQTDRAPAEKSDASG